jgi:hypothetical protein
MNIRNIFCAGESPCNKCRYYNYCADNECACDRYKAFVNEEIYETPDWHTVPIGTPSRKIYDSVLSKMPPPDPEPEPLVRKTIDTDIPRLGCKYQLDCYTFRLACARFLCIRASIKTRSRSGKSCRSRSLRGAITID